MTRLPWAEDAGCETELIRRACAALIKACGREAEHVAIAPGRVNLIGEHTDYNDGFVLPMALEVATVVVLSPRSERAEGARIRSLELNEAAEVVLSADAKPRRDGSFTSYVQGVVSEMLRAGFEVPPFDAVCTSSVPIGGGLSSSAALEVATATALEALCDRRLEPLDKAKLCQRAEREHAGVPCGIMDQYISVHGVEGSALELDCRSLQAREVPLDDEHVAIAIFNTGVKHGLAESEYSVRTRQCAEAAAALGVVSLREAFDRDIDCDSAKLDARLAKRAKHVISECARVRRSVEAIEARDWRGFGRLLDASHVSLRDDYEVSCVELDRLVECCRSMEGVYGARMTGGGFGGSVVCLVDAAQVESVCRDLLASGLTSGPGLISRPAAGARLSHRRDSR